MSTNPRPSFSTFYVSVFLPEHRHSANVALHVIGTVAGLALLAWAPWAGQPWWLLAFPVVHAAPGLLGHRLFERNAEVGDVRVLRTDYPKWWFMLANHRMAWDLVRSRLRGA